MRGRKQKPYRTSDGQYIEGLYKIPRGNRWRIVATGERFSEPDERLAVKKFYEKTAGTKKVIVPLTPVLQPWDNPARDAEGLRPIHPSQTVTPADEATLYRWFREQLDQNPHHVAKMVGCPELVRWKQWALPAESITLSQIIANYKRHSPAIAKSQSEALSSLERLIEFAGVKTLDDLTTETLLDFKAEIERTVQAPSTRKAYYSRIKSIIGFGLKTGMEAKPITDALARCKVLWTPQVQEAPQPTPISREHFHQLLKHADGVWHGMLLVGLNFCMSIDEVCNLQWSHMDLDSSTYAAIRGKTKRKRVPKAAVVWTETGDWLRKQLRRGTYVFISKHGTKWNKNSRVKAFKTLVRDAEVPNEITFNWVRDGSYTAAVKGTNGQAAARVLGGHRAPGLEDHYVLRHPELARPACEAVYRSYFG